MLAGLGRGPPSTSSVGRPTSRGIILAATDPLAPDLAPVRFLAGVAGRTVARVTVPDVFGDATALVAGQNGEDPVDGAAVALERAVRLAHADGRAATATSAPRRLA